MENLVNSSPLILVLVFLVIGFVFLMKGADFFVEGSSSIAKRLKVPPIIIGLTIVAMGTSLPDGFLLYQDRCQDGTDSNNHHQVKNIGTYHIADRKLIAFGGDLTVDAASRIAIDLGMSQTLVGLTIVSIGTSLPELVTSVVAARKNEVDMAVGNAVGSNIFNILMVLGVASAINPVALIRENIIDIVILIVFSLIVWIYAATKQRISRKEGISMVCMYLIYAGYIIWR